MKKLHIQVAISGHDFLNYDHYLKRASLTPNRTSVCLQVPGLANSVVSVNHQRLSESSRSMRHHTCNDSVVQAASKSFNQLALGLRIRKTAQFFFRYPSAWLRAETSVTVAKQLCCAWFWFK